MHLLNNMHALFDAPRNQVKPYCVIAGLAAAPALEGLQIAHKWLADLLVYFSKDVTAYSAVRLVSILLFVTSSHIRMSYYEH
jgi:hypothetical protein